VQVSRLLSEHQWTSKDAFKTKLVGKEVNDTRTEYFSLLMTVRNLKRIGDDNVLYLS
jgi:phosphate uptake regulator